MFDTHLSGSVLLGLSFERMTIVVRTQLSGENAVGSYGRQVRTSFKNSLIAGDVEVGKGRQ